MDNALFERLLYEEESTTLDFKKVQYRFVKAAEDEKSELLKDILGFANSWRRADAYILIGVEDVRGGRGNVIGIPATDHLDDHSLQQFVNNLSNRPIQFHYEAFGIDGKQVGVIQIDRQLRPFYLNKDYGKLGANKVYVRRGSSTDPTKPASIDEIARMGNDVAAVSANLSGLTLEIEFNRNLSAKLKPVFQTYIDTYGLGTNITKPNPVPPHRFRVEAMAAYLKHPSLADSIDTANVEGYWDRATVCNAMMDKVVGITTVAVVDQVIEGVMQMIPEIELFAAALIANISSLGK